MKILRLNINKFKILNLVRKKVFTSEKNINILEESARMRCNFSNSFLFFMNKFMLFI